MRRDGVPRMAFVTFATATLVAMIAFGWYAVHRQAIAEHRADIYRRDLCAILGTIPGHVPQQIAQARRDFARSGHPEECRSVVPTPKPTRVPVLIDGRPRVIVVNPPPQQQSRGPAPRLTHESPRPAPRPTPTHSSTPRPTPTPSHTPLCVVGVGPVCIHA